MSSTRVLKSRIRSVKSTKQITKAMQLVAASKKRRAQEAEKASDPYAQAASEILTYLASQGLTQEHPLFEKRPLKSRLFVVISSDKGLAGAYNTNIVRTYLSELKKDEEAGIQNETIAIGRKASQFVSKLKHTKVVGIYEDMTDHPAGRELQTILDTVKQRFLSKEVDAVDLVYTEYVNSIRQETRVKRIMPAGFTQTEVSQDVREAVYEPDLETVLDGVAYRLVGAQVFQALLDARASEHSMRMVAMKNATDNANDLVEDLTLAMNQARQGAITQELAEISSGVEAMN